MFCLDEMEKEIFLGDIPKENDESPADTTQTEEEQKERSPEEIEAMEKLEKIFQSVSQNKPQAPETQEEAPAEEQSLEQEKSNSPAKNQTEIELITIEKPTLEEKEAQAYQEELGKKKRKQLFAKKAFLAVLVVVLVMTGGYFYADYMPGKDNGQVIVTVSEGAGTAEIAGTLQKEGVISSKLFYRIMSKLCRVDGKYNFGKFQLERNAGYKEIFRTLTQAGHKMDAVKVTIPEGYEIYKIADTLSEKGLIDKDKFYYLVDYGEFDYDFVKELPQRDNRLEGYLFPDTYYFVPGDEYGVINEMLAQFDVVYQEYKDRADEIGMSMDEVITLASIIEREARGDEDRKLVSSVFHNRLKSAEYPYLQSCATVQYVLKERKAVLSVEDTRIDSPYNTYINKGLPIGPIASPGKKAIEAALYPEESPYLFFVLGSDNKHHFSETFGEHKQNKNN